MSSLEDRRIAHLNKTIKKLIDVLAKTTLTCEAVHHDKRDYHTENEPCPVMERINVAINNAWREVYDD